MPLKRHPIPAVKFETIDDILKHQFVGNHASDDAAFRGIDAFVTRKDVSKDDKAKAREWQSVAGMGFPPSKRFANAKFIREYLGGNPG